MAQVHKRVGFMASVLIRLNPAVFAPGGMFENVPRNAAKLHLGVGRNDLYAGKLSAGSQNVLLIDAMGADIQPDAFESYMNLDSMKSAYGLQILDFMYRGLIQCINTVSDPAVPMTVVQVRTYVAP